MSNNYDVFHKITSKSDDWIFGKTFINNVYFSDWCKYTGDGRVPDEEYLRIMEQKRIEKATKYHKMNPREPSKDYFEVCKKYPLKDPVKQTEWETKYHDRLD